MTRRRYRRHNQSLALFAAIAALALFGAPPLVPAFARAADPSADQIIAESLTDDPIAVAENNRLDRNFDVDADADFDLDANPTSAGTPAHLPDVVAALGDAVKNLAVDIPRLANLTEVLSDQSARVQATSERISGLDAQIHATENQARKAFHAKVRALAHAFLRAGYCVGGIDLAPRLELSDETLDGGPFSYAQADVANADEVRAEP